jgi:hypothetical protein
VMQQNDVVNLADYDVQATSSGASGAEEGSDDSTTN